MAVLIKGLVALKHFGSALTPRILVVSAIVKGEALVIISSGSFALLAYRYISSTLMTGENLNAKNKKNANKTMKTNKATKLPKTALTETDNIKQNPTMAPQAQNGGVSFSRNSNWFMR